MLILGISSADKVLSVALVANDELLVEINVSGPRAKSENIVRFVKQALEQAGQQIEKVDAIAVVQGPGSYGGIRGGVTAAKSFAQVLNVPVMGVSTLEAMAYDQRNSARPVLAVLAAKQNELNAALFAPTGSGIRRLTDDFVVEEVKLKQKIEAWGEKILVTRNFARAANAAWLAAGKISDAGMDNFLKLIPKYSHQPNLRML